MTDTTQKSCWGITLWAVAIVIGLILIVSILADGGQSAGMAAKSASV